MKSIIMFLILLGCQNSVINSTNEQRRADFKKDNVKKVNPEEELAKTKREFEIKIKELNLENNVSKDLLEKLAIINFDSNFVFQDKLQELNSKLNDSILDKLNNFLETNDFENFNNFISKLDLNYNYEFRNTKCIYLVIRKFFSSYNEKYIELAEIIRKKIFKNKNFKMQDHYLKIFHKFRKKLKEVSYQKSRIEKRDLMLDTIFKRKQDYAYVIKYLIEGDIKKDLPFKTTLLKYSLERFEGSELLSTIVDYCVLVNENYEKNITNIKNIIELSVEKSFFRKDSLPYLLTESLKFVIRDDNDEDYSLKSSKRILEILSFIANRIEENTLTNILRKARFSSTGEMNIEIFNFFNKRVPDKREMLTAFLSNVASYDKKITEEYKRFILKALESFRGKFINSFQASLVEKIENKLGY